MRQSRSRLVRSSSGSFQHPIDARPANAEWLGHGRAPEAWGFHFAHPSQVYPEPAALGLPAPIFAALPLHRDACGIANLDPNPARTRLIGAIHPLGDNALGFKPAGVREHGRAVLGNVFVEQDASLSTAQQLRQRGFAVEERKIPQILSIAL